MRNEKGAEYRSDRVICHMCWNSGFFVVEFKKHREVCTEIIPEVQPEPMSEQSVSDSDVSGNTQRTVQILRNCRRRKKVNQWSL